MPTALTRAISPKLVECELTHVERELININKAEKQHLLYEGALKQMGFSIRRIPETPQFPDGVFIEDTAVVFPELAIITRPGALSRRPETESMATVLKEYRQLYHIHAPGTLDGGDVLVLGKRVFIGISSRTNKEAIKQFDEILKPFGYEVIGISISKSLHLKTAVSAIDDSLLLINPDWINADFFEGYHCHCIHPQEPFAANVISYENQVLCSSAFPRTIDRLTGKNYNVLQVDQSELSKAEAGLTCCSVIIE